MSGNNYLYLYYFGYEVASWVGQKVKIRFLTNNQHIYSDKKKVIAFSE